MYDVFLSFIVVCSLKPVLTVCFTSGDISLMSNYDDLSPTTIHTGLKGALKMILPVLHSKTPHSSFGLINCDVSVRCGRAVVLSG